MAHSPRGVAREAGKSLGPFTRAFAGMEPELSDADFFSFCRLVHRHAGIHLKAQKKELVRARLLKVLRQRKSTTFREYYERVMTDASGAELTCLLDALSTNQTAFWREPGHFQYLAQEILPAWPPERRTPFRGSFWSAGCSSGEEPYTLAMVLMEALLGEDLSRVKIHASDLNTQVLAQAERGVYPLSRICPLPPEWQRRFFQKGLREWEGFARVRAEVRHLVKFFRLNLMDSLPFREELDVIFCRNVMIYFEEKTKAHLVEKFHQCLRPGGYLFIGPSESLCNHQHRFHYVKPTIYRK